MYVYIYIYISYQASIEFQNTYWLMIIGIIYYVTNIYI